MLPPSFDRRTVGKYVPAVTAGFAVFTRDPYPGDDHTKAAMLLAEHLSRRLGPAEATDIFAVPVHPSALDWWRQRSGLPNKEANLLLTWADAAVISPADEVSALVERRVMEEVIGPKLVELWEGRSAEEVAHDIVTDIDGLQAVAKPATGSLIHLQ